MNEKTRTILIAGAVLVLILLIVVLVPSGGATDERASGLSPEEVEAQERIITESRAAIEDFNERNEEDPEVYYNEYLILANAYARLGEYDNAREAYEAALEYAEEGDTEVWMKLYDLAILEGDLEEAEQVLVRAMEAQPEATVWWEVRLNLASEEMNLDAEALETLHLESLEATDRATGMLVLYANFLEEQGRFEEALQLWEEAAAKNPGQPIFTENAARVRALVGQPNTPLQ